MNPLLGQPILAAAALRRAEECAIEAGSSVAELVERAGAGVAEWARRLAAGAPILVLCGPGNNGGDGYVAARLLKAQGVEVRVAAASAPKTEAAVAAHAAWDGPVEALADAAPAPVLVDALFGTGLKRPIEPALNDRLETLKRGARLSIAVDLPSGLDCDTGNLLCRAISPVDLTLALGAVKPVHVLSGSAGLCGAVRVVDLGIFIPTDGDIWMIGHPRFDDPGSGSTKYNRGMVVVVGGVMPGAAALAGEAAMRAGAGYVLLLAGERPAGTPHALVQRPWSPDALDDARIGAVLIGPGLGRDAAARAKLDAAIASGHTLVIDGDALHLLGERRFHARERPVILTPHGGEFTALFGAWSGSKIDAARAAAARSGAVVVFKGADTVIADPEGRVEVSPNGSPWLSTAGTGDVLAGAVAALATHAKDGGFPVPGPATPAITKTRVASAVWLHGEAARRLGPAFIADDLLRELTAVRASL